MPRHDAILILGSGPAGSTAASTLAQRGHEVHLFESRAFPRVKVCGEYLSPAVTQLLEERIGSPELARCGARRVEQLQVYANEVCVMDWPLPRPAWSLSRASLDDMLLDRATDAGAIVHQPVTVHAADYHEDRIELRTSAGSFTGTCVVHADGSGRFDPAGPVPARRGVVGVKCHLRLEQSIGSVLRMHGFSSPHGRGYFGAIGIEGGAATMAMVVDASALKRHCGNHDALFRTVWPRSCGVYHRISDWHSCPVAGSRYVTPGHVRSFRIGNAAAAVEPVGGEGIGLALWSGDLLGRTLDPTRLHQSQRLMARAYHHRLRWRIPACRFAAGLLSRPGLLRSMLPALPNADWLLRGLYRFSGKPT